MRKHDWRSFSLRALESLKGLRSAAVNSRSFTFFQLTSSRRMWKSTKKKTKLTAKATRFCSFCSSLRDHYPQSRESIILSSASRRFFCDSRTVHMTLRNNGLRSFPDRREPPDSDRAHAYSVGSRIIRLQSFALNHEANDASWR